MSGAGVSGCWNELQSLGNPVSGIHRAFVSHLQISKRECILFFGLVSWRWFKGCLEPRSLFQESHDWHECMLHVFHWSTPPQFSQSDSFRVGPSPMLVDACREKDTSRYLESFQCLVLSFGSGSSGWVTCSICPGVSPIEHLNFSRPGHALPSVSAPSSLRNIYCRSTLGKAHLPSFLLL